MHARLQLLSARQGCLQEERRFREDHTGTTGRTRRQPGSRVRRHDTKRILKVCVCSMMRLEAERMEARVCGRTVTQLNAAAVLVSRLCCHLMDGPLLLSLVVWSKKMQGTSSPRGTTQHGLQFDFKNKNEIQFEWIWYWKRKSHAFHLHSICFDEFYIWNSSLHVCNNNLFIASC